MGELIINRRVYIKIILVFFFLTSFQYINATEADASLKEKGLDIVQESVGFDEYIGKIEKYVDENMDSEIKDIFNVNEMTDELLLSGKINGSKIMAKLLNIFFREVVISLKGATLILVIVILIGVLKNIQLDEDSSVNKITFISCYMVIATIMIKTFVETINLFSNTVGAMTTAMEVISPFLMLVLLATGAITTTGIIQPVILFIASFIGFVIKNLIIPFLCLSVSFNVIDSISSELNLNRLSKVFTKASVWIIGILLTAFLSILSLETQITSSVDSLAIKTTQAAVSNFVPVVGKFFSDSFETVVGAAKVFGKVGGVIGIISVFLITIIPVLKVTSIFFIYSGLSILSETIGCDSKLVKTFDGFSGVYKMIVGIMIGVLILFVISTGIILNLYTSVVK